HPHLDGDRLVFVDFGMMGIITPRMRSGLRDVFLGVVAQDAPLVVTGLDKLGVLAETAAREAIEQLVAAMLANYSELSAGQVRSVDPRGVLRDVGPAFYDNPLRLPAQFAFFGRAVGMLLGLVVGLSPRFNFLEVATPYAQEFMGTDGLSGILRLFGVES